MIPAEVTVQIAKEDFTGSDNHPARDPLAKALKRKYPFLREVWVGDKVIQLQDYGRGKLSVSVNLDHNDASRQFLADYEKGIAKPLKLTLVVKSIKQIGRCLASTLTITPTQGLESSKPNPSLQTEDPKRDL